MFHVEHMGGATGRDLWRRWVVWFVESSRLRRGPLRTANPTLGRQRILGRSISTMRNWIEGSTFGMDQVDFRVVIAKSVGVAG